MTAHSAEAKRLLAALDADLADTARKVGKTMSWSGDEVELREMLANAVDRRADVATAYAGVDRADYKNLVRLSAELRMLDSLVSRLLKSLKTDAPQPMSLTSLKAQRASRARWDKERSGATG